MLKKLLPFVVMALVTACSGNLPASHMSCCDKCECCQSGECGECCKDGECDCCKDGACPMCADHKGTAASADKPCAICDEAAREWKAEHGTMKR